MRLPSTGLKDGEAGADLRGLYPSPAVRRCRHGKNPPVAGGTTPESSWPLPPSSGKSFPEDLSEYKLVIHCGGCMLSEREVRYRMKCAQIRTSHHQLRHCTVAYMKGILRRSIAVFPKLWRNWRKLHDRQRHETAD